MTHTVGDRVGVLTDDGAVFGVYNGDLPCDALDGHPNPNITLDSGTVVWGYEVWWGPEQRIRDYIAKLRDAEEDAQ